MVNRSKEIHASPPPPSSKTPTHPYSWGDSPAGQHGKETDEIETGKSNAL